MAIADVMNVVAVEIHEAVARDVLKLYAFRTAYRGKARSGPGLAEEPLFVARIDVLAVPARSP
jgi:hypothetical protein